MTDFKLYPPQKQALITEAKEVLYGGAVGGGKSYLIRVATIMFSLEVPGLITYLFRRTFKEVLSNHVYTPGGYIEMLKNLIESGDVVYSKTDNAFTFYNGSRIQLAHCQHEDDVYNYQGAQIGLLVIDEATHFSPKMVKFLRTRVRLGSLVVPPKWKAHFPRILYTANPGNIGHHYFKSNFVDIAKNKIIVAPDDDGGMTRMYIPAKLSDNKVLMETDPDYAKRVMGLGDVVMAQALIDGDWELLSTGGFSTYWRNNKHVIEPFSLPQTWRINRCYDYGSSAPAAALWFAESNGEDFVDSDGIVRNVPKGSLFIIQECYIANSKQEGLKLTGAAQAKLIRQIEEKEVWGGRTRAGPADNAIFSADPGRSSIADDMADEEVTFIRSDKSPGSRIQGVGLMNTRLESTADGSLEKPHIYVFSICYNTIRTIPNLENDKRNTEDIDTTGEDHIWDVIRYRLLQSASEIKTGKLSGV